MTEDYNEFEQEMESLRQEISKLIKNHFNRKGDIND